MSTIHSPLDRTGSFASGDGWIETFNGTPFNIAAPLPETISIEDIAHSLAMQCRFNGHCQRFYSVAEHCCHVHDELLSQYGLCDLALAGLLHDASEAYLSDIARPVKPMLTNYAALEHTLQSAIYARFGVPPIVYEDPDIKRLDNALCMLECRNLMASAGKDWGWGSTQPALVTLQCWAPDVAKVQFLKRFAYYERM
jgi:hypothetical protein